MVDVLPQVAAAHAAELGQELAFRVEAVPLAGRERAVRDSELIVTVTTGNQPLVERDWLWPGAFVARLGSFQELALDVIIAADKVVVYCWHYVRPPDPRTQDAGRGGTLWT